MHVAAIGTTVSSKGDTKTYRIVNVPDEQLKWYRNRCGLAMHNNYTREEWLLMLGQDYFIKKFTPAVDYVMPRDEDIAEEVKKAAEQIFKKNAGKVQTPTGPDSGRDLTTAPVMAVPPVKDTPGAPVPPIRPDADPKPQVPVGPITTASTSPTNTLEGKLLYLKLLITQGDDAVYAALKKGTVTVKSPKTIGANPTRPVSTGIKHNGDTITPRQAGFILKRHTDGTFGKGTTHVRKELHKKGLIVDDNDQQAVFTDKGLAALNTLLTTAQTPGVLAS